MKLFIALIISIYSTLAFGDVSCQTEAKAWAMQKAADVGSELLTDQFNPVSKQRALELLEQQNELSDKELEEALISIENTNALIFEVETEGSFYGPGLAGMLLVLNSSDCSFEKEIFYFAE